jgi:hypothetical protein
MAQNVTEIFRATVPSAGLVLKARADIAGKREAFERRIREDSPDGGAALLTEYSANADCTFNFEGGDAAKDIPFAAGGEPVKAPPAFFETRCFFRGDFTGTGGRAVRDVRVEHRMASVADAFNFDEGTLVGTLDFVNEPGRFRLDLRISFADGTERTVRLEFTVVSVKMNVARDYTEIVKTIDREKPNIVRAFLSKTFWGAALDREGEPDGKSWYDILVEVFDYYEGACRRIAGNPHRRYLATDDWRRADRVRRWTPVLADRYNRLGGDARERERFRTERLVAESDTPENRFVLHTLKELRRRLEDFGRRLKDVPEVSQPWKDGISDRALRLKRLAEHPFFRGVSRFEGFRQQSLVMQKSAGYAQILTAWLKLKSALRPGGDDIDVGYRPISTLYEFWCFLKMRDCLKERFGEPEKEEWTDRTPDDVLDVRDLADGETGGDQLCKIDAAFSDGARTILLSYQKTYPARDGADGETLAGLNPQRPDIVLSISEGESVFTYLFDAKYRIWVKDADGREIDASPRAAIDDMHRYRDAILYRLGKTELKHEIIGAYVLYPGRPEPHLCKEYDESIRRENIGAIPLLPGHLEQLERRLGEILGKRDAHAHLDGTIPTRGTSAFVDGIAGAAEDLTLYGTSHGAGSEKSAWVEKHLLYPLPCEEAEGKGILTEADARRKRILALAAPPRGRRTADVEVFFITGVERVSREELAGMGYPKPGHAAYWLFTLKR